MATMAELIAGSQNPLMASGSPVPDKAAPLRQALSREAGQRRRAWLDDKSEQATEALRYYLGPAAQPVEAAMSIGAVLAPGQDVADATQAGRDLMDWNGPLDAAGDAATMTAALGSMMLPGGVSSYRQGIDALAGEMAGAYDPNTLNAFTVYHGSPHTFDRFSLDHIGTGEGAQAYGHGLYFAEKEGVARGYRDALTGNHTGGNVVLRVGGREVAEPTSVQRAVARFGADEASNIFIRNLERARAKLDDLPAYSAGDVDDMDLERMVAEADVSTAQKAIDEVDSLRGVDVGYGPPGSLYEVEIDAEPEDFLDWDAPLSEQPQGVREAFQAFAAQNPEHVDPVTAGGQYENPTGRDFLGAYGEATPHNPDDMFDYRRRFTTDMQAAGIPGIRYLDQGSRDGGQGTRNYVLFDDTLASILSRNGQPMGGR